MARDAGIIHNVKSRGPISGCSPTTWQYLGWSHRCGPLDVAVSAAIQFREPLIKNRTAHDNNRRKRGGHGVRRGQNDSETALPNSSLSPSSVRDRLSRSDQYWICRPNDEQGVSHRQPAVRNASWNFLFRLFPL